MTEKHRRGTVRRIVPVAIISAFFACALFPFFAEFLDPIAGAIFTCDNIIPKLDRVASVYSKELTCIESRRLWLALCFLISAYVLAMLIVICVVGVDRKYAKVFVFNLFGNMAWVPFIFATATISIGYYTFGDLSLRPGRIKIESYNSLESYSRAQIYYLMYMVNLMLFGLFGVVSAEIFKRDKLVR